MGLHLKEWGKKKIKKKYPKSASGANGVLGLVGNAAKALESDCSICVSFLHTFLLCVRYSRDPQGLFNLRRV